LRAGRTLDISTGHVAPTSNSAHAAVAAASAFLADTSATPMCASPSGAVNTVIAPRDATFQSFGATKAVPPAVVDGVSAGEGACAASEPDKDKASDRNNP
jgi:hypothetical protein